MTNKDKFWLDYSIHLGEWDNTCSCCGNKMCSYIQVLLPDALDYHDVVNLCEKCFKGDNNG